MATVHEQNIRDAIAAVENGEKQGVAAAAFNVHPSTLSRRLRGATNHKASKIDAQKLSPVQEAFLVDWYLNQEAAGRAPSKAEIARMAQEVLRQSGSEAIIRARWPDRFLQRHKRVKTKKGVLLERARVRGSTKATYEDFFQRLGTQLREKKILPYNISNMDEHGMQETETTTGTVIEDSLTNHAVITGPNNTTWVSIIEAVTAKGRRLTPVIIFTNATLQGQSFPPKLKKEEDIRD